MRHTLAIGLLFSIGLFGCANEGLTTSTPTPTKVGGMAAGDLAGVNGKLSNYDGRKMRVRTFMRMPNGSRLLTSSVPVEFVHNRAIGKLTLRRTTPLVQCTPLTVGAGLEVIKPCNTRMMEYGDPTDVEEFNEGISSFYSSVASAPPDTAVTGLTSDSILVQSIEFPDGIADYSGSSLISFDLEHTGRVAGGVIDAEEGFAGGFIATDDEVPTLYVEVTSPVFGSMYLEVTPDSAVYMKDQDALRTGVLMTAGCGQAWGAAAFHTAGWIGTVFAAGYGGRALYTTRVAFVAGSEGSVITGPARKSLVKGAWAALISVGYAAANVWESMHNAIQDAKHCQ